MKALNMFIIHLPSVVGVIAAAMLAYRNCDAWGWFLFVSVLLGATNRDLKTILK